MNTSPKGRRGFWDGHTLRSITTSLSPSNSTRRTARPQQHGESSPLLLFASPARDPLHHDHDDDDDSLATFRMLHAERRAWSMIHGEYNSLRSAASSQRAEELSVVAASASAIHHHHHHHDHNEHDHDETGSITSGIGSATASPHSCQASTITARTNKSLPAQLAYSLVFALVNVIIGLPCLYGYATVIFSHQIYLPFWSALSKLIIASSILFQFTFTCCSALPFVIGAVQDAGLFFLSHMATTIAVTILQDDNDSENSNNDNSHAEEVLSSALVLLSLGTAVLGCIMILLGYFRLAEYIKLLPMPAVGGYLAYIGFYCFQAGVSLSISKNLVSVLDWMYLLQEPGAFWLAVPAVMTGLVFVWLSRNASSDAALPMGMIAILVLFYVVLRVSGLGLDDARNAKWVGEVAPPVPVSELFSLVDFSLVRWDLIVSIFPIWLGMVFVVSFGSCLDITAIFVDMGETTLDINRELSTIGMGNVLSGLFLGYTGSYIFSQSIFTYRTGMHSRWTGAIIVSVLSYVVLSPINVLQVTPLFFLGSTLIFIGYDLMFEWLYEVRQKCRLHEYAIVWATFLIIPIVGVNAGIAIGAILSVLEGKLYSRQRIEE